MSRIDLLLPTDLSPALARLLAPAGHRELANGAQITGFSEYLADSAVRWQGLRCGPRETPTGLFFALLMPGNTALVMLPPPGTPGIVPSDVLHTLTAGLAALRSQKLHFAQVLLEPEAGASRGLLEQAGFRPLAPLLYLEREVRYPWSDPPSPREADWVAYGTQTHNLFADVVLATYQNSLDCPELTGLRPIDDILAAHRASGRFDPQLWQLARLNGRPAAPAGCILLSHVRQGAMLEIVYMGVVPACRRRGVGALLLRRALARCREVDARQLMVVVDERNEPAKRLYERFAFRPVTRRDAFLYRWC